MKSKRLLSIRLLQNETSSRIFSVRVELDQYQEEYPRRIHFYSSSKRSEIYTVN